MEEPQPWHYKTIGSIVTIVMLLIANLAATLMIIKEGTALLTTLVEFISINQPLFDSLAQVLEHLQPV